MQWRHCPAQFSLNGICAIKSVISLEMKCPQLSKPEVTTARNQNSIGDRMEKKTLGETRLSRGASSPLARQTSCLFQLQQSQIVRAPLVPVVFSRWLSRWRGPHWGSVSGAHLGVLVSADVQSCRGCLQVLIHHLIWIRTGSGDCSDHLGWIRTGSGGSGDFGIRKKKTYISIDVNLLTM